MKNSRPDTHIGQYPCKQDIRPHVRIIVPRELFLLGGTETCRLGEGLAVAEVIEGLFVDVVHVSSVRRYLEVDL